MAISAHVAALVFCRPDVDNRWTNALNPKIIGDRFLLDAVAFSMEEPLNNPDWRTLKSDLAGRIRDVRIALYGEHGGPLLAQSARDSFPDAA